MEVDEHTISKLIRAAISVQQHRLPARGEHQNLGSVCAPNGGKWQGTIDETGA